MSQQSILKTSTSASQQQEIQELKGVITLLTQQMKEMKQLLHEICNMVVTDKSMKKEFVKSLD